MTDFLSHLATWFSGATLVFAVVPVLIKVLSALLLEWKHVSRNASIVIRGVNGDVKLNVQTDDPESVERLFAELEKQRPSTSPSLDTPSRGDQ